MKSRWYFGGLFFSFSLSFSFLFFLVSSISASKFLSPFLHAPTFSSPLFPFFWAQLGQEMGLVELLYRLG
jgi:hypothetical protein